MPANLPILGRGWYLIGAWVWRRVPRVSTTSGPVLRRVGISRGAGRGLGFRAPALVEPTEVNTDRSARCPGGGSWGLEASGGIVRRARDATGLVVLCAAGSLGFALGVAVSARLSERLEVGSLASRPGRGLAAIACGTQAPVRKSQGGKAQYGAYRPRRRELPDSGWRSAVCAAGWWRNATAAQQARGLELIARRHRPDL